MKVYVHVYPNKGEAGKNRPPEAVTIELEEYVKGEVEKATKDQAALIKEIVEGEVAKLKLKKR